MIKNIIFDIGNVLVDFCWQQFFRDNLKIPEELFERVANATVRSSEWSEIDRGILSPEEVTELLVKNDPEIEEYIRPVLSTFKGMVKEFPYAKGLIIDMQKRGYKVYCLSNMSYMAIEDCKDEFGFVKYLDGILFSCDAKLIKPDIKIYEKICENYNLDPKECVFFDDIQKNVDVAKEAGMEGILFTDLKEALAEFEKLDTIEKHPEVKTYTKSQRVAALVAVIMIVLVFFAALIAAMINTDTAKIISRIAFSMIIVIPILTWIAIWIVGLLKNKHTIASFDLFKNMNK